MLPFDCDNNLLCACNYYYYYLCVVGIAWLLLVPSMLYTERERDACHDKTTWSTEDWDWDGDRFSLSNVVLFNSLQNNYKTNEKKKQKIFTVCWSEIARSDWKRMKDRRRIWKGNENQTKPNRKKVDGVAHKRGHNTTIETEEKKKKYVWSAMCYSKIIIFNKLCV